MVDQSQCNLLSLALEGISNNNNDNNPYFVAFYTCVAISLLTFAVSTITRNYSQVDKVWSITPVLYAWFAVVDQRTLLMAILATIWGIRLTWNFNRRGGYKWPIWEGDEDYRWACIQKGHYIDILKYPVPWMLFNFGFISFYQNFLLMLTAAPSFVASTMATDPSCSTSTNGNGKPLDMFGLDGIATVMMVVFIVIESIADNQQYEFQKEKYRQIEAVGVEQKGKYADGFRQSGLFAIVRKPNYASEQMIWISYYLFSISASGKILNWSVIGCTLLVLLFQLSGRFTEKLTLMKYPVAYASYQQRVGLYAPRLFQSKNVSDEKKGR